MRRAREIWVGIIRQFEQSDMTQEAFADERGIPVATLRSWIYKLRHEEQPSSPLLPVRVIASTAPSARQAGDEAAGIEVVVAGGVLIRLAAGTPWSDVVELVSLLRARC